MNFFVELWAQICSFFMQYVAQPIMHMNARDIIDVLLLAFVLYKVFRFAKNRRAGRVMIGLLIVIFLLMLVQLFHLPALSYISNLFVAASFFCIIVIFQPEIRDALERIGNSTFLNPRSDTIPRKHLPLAKSVAEELTDAVSKMSEKRVGVLVVIEGLTKLGDYIQTGKVIDARVTSHLLQNIFYDKAPLHDGALVIRDMRIWAASCVLPSSNGELDFGSMGTRHRAAVGVTEVSDALVVIVSEETGVISMAQDGKLLRDVDRATLYDVLMTYLAGRLYLRTRRGVYVNPFDSVLPYHRQNEEENDLDNMGQMTISEEPAAEEPVAVEASVQEAPEKTPAVDTEVAEQDSDV